MKIEDQLPSFFLPISIEATNSTTDTVLAAAMNERRNNGRPHFHLLFKHPVSTKAASKR